MLGLSLLLAATGISCGGTSGREGAPRGGMDRMSNGGMMGAGQPAVTPAVTTAPGATPDVDMGAELYRANCAGCHGIDRRGGVGPALLPSTLSRDDAYYTDVIANGVPGTSMAAWGARGLSADQIRAVVAYMRAPRSP